MTTVMESEVTSYRLERWIAVILALMFFLPFVANAEESPLAVVSSRDAVHDGPLAWRCRATGMDGFDQCALLLDGKVLTWRMAPEGQELRARLRFNDAKLGMVEISRNGKNWQSHFFSHSSRNSP
jgi:hypothetical protein